MLPKFPYKRTIEVEIYQIEPMIHHAQEFAICAEKNLVRKARDPEVNVPGVVVPLRVGQGTKNVHFFRPERQG